MNHRAIRSLCVLLAAALVFFTSSREARAADRDVDGPGYREADSLLQSTFTGKHVAVLQSMPGNVDGFVVRPDARKPLATRDVYNAVRAYGQAYEAEQAATITGIERKARTLAVLLGGGGYDPGDLPAPQPTTTGPDQRDLQLQYEINQASLLSDTYARDQRVRDLQKQLDDYRRGRAEAEELRLMAPRMAIARASGARIVFRFKHDLAARDLTERHLRELLAPYVRILD